MTAPRKLAPRRPEPARKTASGLLAQTVLERFERYGLTELLTAVVEWTGVSAIELASGAQSYRIARARSWLYVALRRRDWSWTDIGALLDKDNRTCLEGSKRAEQSEDLGRFVEHLNSRAPGPQRASG